MHHFCQFTQKKIVEAFFDKSAGLKVQHLIKKK